MQFYWSNYQEIGLVDIVAALFSLLVTVVFLKVWQPARDPARGGASGRIRGRAEAEDCSADRRSPAARSLKGWSPFIVASVFIFVDRAAGVERVPEVRRR